VQSFNPLPFNCQSCNETWRFITTNIKVWCWDSVIGILTALCAVRCGVWFLAGTRIFLSSKTAQSSPGAHPACYSLGTRAVYCGWRGDGKVAGAQSRWLTSI